MTYKSAIKTLVQASIDSISDGDLRAASKFAKVASSLRSEAQVGQADFQEYPASQFENGTIFQDVNLKDPLGGATNDDVISPYNMKQKAEMSAKAPKTQTAQVDIINIEVADSKDLRLIAQAIVERLQKANPPHPHAAFSNINVKSASDQEGLLTGGFRLINLEVSDYQNALDLAAKVVDVLKRDKKYPQPFAAFDESRITIKARSRD